MKSIIIDGVEYFPTTVPVGTESITIDGIEYFPVTAPVTAPDGTKSIVIADRGWVFIGTVDTKEDGGVSIPDARVIRRWGTKTGLAQLANNGPTDETILEDSCPVLIPLHSVVAVLACGEWS